MLGDSIVLGPPKDFQLTATDGSVVANVKTEASGKNLLLTYTDYVSNHSDIKGTFKLVVRVDHENHEIAEKIAPLSAGQTIDLDTSINVENPPYQVNSGKVKFRKANRLTPLNIRKAGYNTPNTSDVKSLTYRLNINEKGLDMGQVFIIDKLKTSGVQIVPDKSLFKVYKVKFQYDGDDLKAFDPEDGTVYFDRDKNKLNPSKYKITFDSDRKGFKFEFIDPVDSENQYRIYYLARTEYAFSNGQLVYNTAELSTTKTIAGNVKADGRLQFGVAGGSANGYVYQIKVKKVDGSGSALPGAKFALKRNKNNFTIERTVDNTGYIVFDGLLKEAYTLTEVEAPEGYDIDSTPTHISPSDFETATNKIYEVTRTNQTAEKRDIKVSKKWATGSDPQNISIELKADGVVKETVNFSASDSMEKTWNVDKYDRKGHEIAYTVHEKDENAGEITLGGEKYYVVYGGNMTTGFEITNSKVAIPTKNITVKKEWSGEAPVDKVWVELYRDGNPTGNRIELKKDSVWTGTFSNQPVSATNMSTPYVYSVREIDKTGKKVEEGQIGRFGKGGYTVNYTGDVDTGFTVKNTENPIPTININVSKKWQKNDGGDLDATNIPVDSVTVELYRNGSSLKTMDLTATSSWQGSFDDLPESEEYGGSKYEYIIKEIDKKNKVVEAGEMGIFNGRTFEAAYGGTMATGFMITNKETTPPEIPKVNVKVEKKWTDSSNAEMEAPVESITVKLFRDGVPTTDTLELKKAELWKGEFSNLPSAEIYGGTAYDYTVKEVDASGNVIEEDGEVILDGKDFTVTYDNTTAGTVKITNKEIPTVNVKVKKQWKNSSDSEITAPVDEITVKLYKDGADTTKTLKLQKTGATPWEGEFTGLRKATGGTDHVYTVKELDVSNNSIEKDSEVSLGGKTFIADYTKDTSGILVITNKEKSVPSGGGGIIAPYIPPTEPEKPEKPEEPTTPIVPVLPGTPDVPEIPNNPIVPVVPSFDIIPPIPVEVDEEPEVPIEDIISDVEIPRGSTEIPEIPSIEEIPDNGNGDEFIGIELDDVPRGDSNIKEKENKNNTKKILAKTGGKEIHLFTYFSIFIGLFSVFLLLGFLKKRS